MLKFFAFLGFLPQKHRIKTRTSEFCSVTSTRIQLQICYTSRRRSIWRNCIVRNCWGLHCISLTAVTCNRANLVGSTSTDLSALMSPGRLFWDSMSVSQSTSLSSLPWISFSVSLSRIQFWKQAIKFGGWHNTSICFYCQMLLKVLRNKCGATDMTKERNLGSMLLDRTGSLKF